MTATNHALFGVALAASFDRPLIALPLALVSHFALDMLPHFGPGNNRRLFFSVLVVDMLLLVSVFLLTIIHFPYWYVIAALLAISPDFAWGYRFVFQERFGAMPAQPKSGFNAVHAAIQWFEKPIGLLIEIPVTVILGYVLFAR